MPTAIWHLRLRSGSAHCDQALAGGEGGGRGGEEPPSEKSSDINPTTLTSQVGNNMRIPLHMHNNKSVLPPSSKLSFSRGK